MLRSNASLKLSTDLSRTPKKKSDKFILHQNTPMLYQMRLFKTRSVLFQLFFGLFFGVHSFLVIGGEFGEAITLSDSIMQYDADSFEFVRYGWNLYTLRRGIYFSFPNLSQQSLSDKSCPNGKKKTCAVLCNFVHYIRFIAGEETFLYFAITTNNFNIPCQYFVGEK